MKTPLKAQNDYICYKFGGRMAPLALLWLRLCFGPPSEIFCVRHSV